MKNPPAKLLLAVLALAAAGAAFAAVTPAEWANRQTVTVAAPGLTRLPLPPAAFDTAQPGLADLRLLDPEDRELAFLLDRAGGSRDPARPEPRRPRSFRAQPAGELTQVILETGTAEKLESVLLESAAPFFLKAAHVDISANGETWQSLGPAVPVFRQFGAEQLRLSLHGLPAAFVRVTLDDYRNRAVDFSGASLALVPPGAAAPVFAPAAARITRRDEFASETVLTIAFDGWNLPLAALGLDVADELFMRRVTITLREAQGDTSRERTVATGTLYRVDLEGAEARSQLELALPEGFLPPGRELLVHIHNGDSPPLAVRGASAQLHPVNLLFNAPVAGTYRLLTGNAQAASPRYDLAAFAREMRVAGATVAVAGALEATPRYQPRATLSGPPLPDVPLSGAPLDTPAWAQHRTLRLDQAGVQELELDPAALAGARGDYGDVRLLRGGNQIPYVLEQPPLFRALSLTPVVETDPTHPGRSVWRLVLPQAGLPLARLTLTSSTPLFSREFRVFEKVSTPDGRTEERVVAGGAWHRQPEPGERETRELEIAGRLRTDTLWIETDNGDNPAIMLGAVQATHPVVRLVFKTDATDGFTVAYANPAAGSPRYDLSLVAARLLTASRLVAHFDSPGTAPSRGGVGGLKSGVVFWSVLVLVVIGLLVAVARLLPKPPAGNDQPAP